MSWKGELLQDIHNKLSPIEFEKLVYNLLENIGFSELELLGQSGDGGVDLKSARASPFPESFRTPRFSPRRRRIPGMPYTLGEDMRSPDERPLVAALNITETPTTKNPRPQSMRACSRDRLMGRIRRPPTPTISIPIATNPTVTEGDILDPFAPVRSSNSASGSPT